MGNCCGKRDPRPPRLYKSTDDDIFCIYERHNYHMIQYNEKDWRLISTNKSGNFETSGISSGILKNKSGLEKYKVTDKDIDCCIQLKDFLGIFFCIKILLKITNYNKNYRNVGSIMLYKLN